MPAYLVLRNVKSAISLLPLFRITALFVRPLGSTLLSAIKFVESKMEDKLIIYDYTTYKTIPA